MAFVILKEGYEESEKTRNDIYNYLRATIATYKLPREIFFVKSLPRHATGKLLRRELKEIAKKMYVPKD